MEEESVPSGTGLSVLTIPDLDISCQKVRQKGGSVACQVPEPSPAASTLSILSPQYSQVQGSELASALGSNASSTTVDVRFSARHPPAQCPSL